MTTIRNRHTIKRFTYLAVVVCLFCFGAMSSYGRSLSPGVVAIAAHKSGASGKKGAPVVVKEALSAHWHKPAGKRSRGRFPVNSTSGIFRLAPACMEGRTLLYAYDQPIVNPFLIALSLRGPPAA